MKFSTLSPRVIGVLQAIALVAYVCLFALVAQTAQSLVAGLQLAIPVFFMLFLLAFVTSALICVTIMFAIPVWMFTKDRRKDAVHTFLWSVASLMVIALTVLLLAVAGLLPHARSQEVHVISVGDVSPVPAIAEPFVKVGDTLGAMTVISAEPFNSGQYSTDPASTVMGPRNIKVVLRGPIEVTGTSALVHSPIGFDGDCMSEFDSESLSRLPTLPGEPPPPYRIFCFRDAASVEKILGTETRRVTVLIDTYELNSYPAEVMDYADLAGIVSK